MNKNDLHDMLRKLIEKLKVIIMRQQRDSISLILREGENSGVFLINALLPVTINNSSIFVLLFT